MTLPRDIQRGRSGNKAIAGQRKAGKRVVGGRECFFRSAWEFRWAVRLQWLKQNGAIAEWEHEPDTFEFPIRHGTTRYSPDFRITRCDGSVYYEEVKGWQRPRGQTQIRRMAKYHPDVELRVIYADEYRDEMRRFGKLMEQVETAEVPRISKPRRRDVPEQVVRALAAQGVTVEQYLKSRGPRRRR